MITADTADQLETLARTIFDRGSGNGLRGQDDASDAQYLALIAPVMLAIDGHAMPVGFRYTLNITCALQGRPKHWHMAALAELEPGSPYPVNMEFSYLYVGVPSSWTGCNSYGYTLAAATCAAVCLAWAMIVRMWLGGNYPLAVNPPPAV